MSSKCNCSHTCTEKDDWSRILKPFKFLFFLWLAIVCISETQRHPHDLVIPALMVGSTAVILALFFAGAWAWDKFHPQREDANA